MGSAKDIVLKLIEENHLESALEILISITKYQGEAQAHHDVILQKSRYLYQTQSFYNNIITYPEYQTELAKIRQALIYQSQNLNINIPESELQKIITHNAKTQSGSPLKFQILAIAITIIVAIIGTFIYIYTIQQSPGNHENDIEIQDNAKDSTANIAPKKIFKPDFKPNNQEEKKDTVFNTPNVVPTTTDNYFNTNINTDIAFLNTGNEIDFKLYEGVSAIFKLNNINSSQQFFRNAKIKQIAHDIKTGEYEYLKSLGINQHIKCVCLVEQEIDYIDNKIQNNYYKTARGTYNISIINTHDGTASQFLINDRGAGLDNLSAKHELEINFLKQFKQKIVNISSCKQSSK